MTTEERILRLLRQSLNLPVSDPEADLLASGLLDSLMLVELLLGLEREFGVRVEMDSLQLEELRSVRRLAALVERINPAG